jgi:enamine deaminase RidA (YjgF/YER057c/UK114 family)
MDRLNPTGVPKPASNYVQAVQHGPASRRLVISGQVGITAEGRVLDGMEAQLRQCWANLLTVLAAAGFEKKQLVKTVIYVTQPGQVALSLRIRDEALEGLPTASTFIQCAGLASPELLCEVEGEAVME